MQELRLQRRRPLPLKPRLPLLERVVRLCRDLCEDHDDQNLQDLRQRTHMRHGEA